MSNYNNQNKFILTCIDCFSRYGWAKPVKNKSGLEIAKVLKEIIKEKRCKRVQSDKGLEFLNKHVQNLFKSFKIEFWTTNNDDIKASIVERYNRTIKTRLFKYFTANNTKKYVDILQQLVDGYNNTVHSSIGFSPSQVNNSLNNIKVRRKLYGKFIPFQGYKFQIGQYVRISKTKRVFKKGYLENWSEEIFKIVNREILGSKALYTIQDLNGQKIEGRFYNFELQKIEYSNNFRIEKVIKKKKIGKTTSYLVRWSGYDNTFDSWVNEKDLKKLGKKLK